MRVYNPYVGWIDVPERPSRIVSLNPSVTEVLFELGVGNRVIGVSSWCHRPREALSLPKVGSYTTVLEERLKELNPDLILTTTGVQSNVIGRLASLGYPTYPLPFPRDVYGILSMVIEVGGLVGEGERALDLCSSLSDELLKLRGLATRSFSPRVYVEIDLGGPTIPALYNHITSAMKLAGLTNVFSERTVSYLYGMKVADYEVLDLNEVLKLKPDVIVYESKSFHPRPDEGLEVMKSRDWGSLEAVVMGRVITLPADTLAHYGPSFLKEIVNVCSRIWSFFGSR